MQSQFRTLRHVSPGVQKILVQVLPWWCLVLAIFYVIFGPVMGVIGIRTVPILYPMFQYTSLLVIGISVVMAVLLVVAYFLLKKRRAAGWKLLFWLTMVEVVILLINIVGARNFWVAGSTLEILITLYVLFEVKSVFGNKLPS